MWNTQELTKHLGGGLAPTCVPNISPGRVLFQKVTVCHFAHIWRKQNDLLSVGKEIAFQWLGLSTDGILTSLSSV